MDGWMGGWVDVVTSHSFMFLNKILKSGFRKQKSMVWKRKLENVMTDPSWRHEAFLFMLPV